MPLPPKNKSILRTIFTPVMVCGCGRSRTTTPAPYSSSRHNQPPKPRKRTPNDSKTPSPLLSSTQTATPATRPSFHGYDTSPLYSFEANNDLGPPVSPRLLRSPCPKIDESVAMAKESTNPFQDFRASIKQMIEERDIESEDDLKELLRCFLDINPPLQHNVIVRAFVDVCSNFQPPHDRRGRSLGRLLRLYVNPVDESHNARK